LSNESSPNKFR